MDANAKLPIYIIFGPFQQVGDGKPSGLWFLNLTLLFLYIKLIVLVWASMRVCKIVQSK